jgi:hypothetical protein
MNQRYVLFFERVRRYIIASPFVESSFSSRLIYLLESERPRSQ